MAAERLRSRASIFNAVLALYNENFKENKTSCASLKLNFTFLRVIKI